MERANNRKRKGLGQKKKSNSVSKRYGKQCNYKYRMDLRKRPKKKTKEEFLEDNKKL